MSDIKKIASLIDDTNNTLVDVLQEENKELGAALGAIHWHSLRYKDEHVMFKVIMEQCEKTIPELADIRHKMGIIKDEN